MMAVHRRLPATVVVFIGGSVGGFLFTLTLVNMWTSWTTNQHIMKMKPNHDEAFDQETSEHFSTHIESSQSDHNDVAMISNDRQTNELTNQISPDGAEQSLDESNNYLQDQHDHNHLQHVTHSPAHNHSGSSDVKIHDDNRPNDGSASLADKVRILCWVMTSPEFHQTRAVHVQATWGKRCNKLMFVTEQDDGSLPILHVDVETGREHLTAKTMGAFHHIFLDHINEADWFLKADDDTYVIMENLRYFLSSQDTESPVYFGHHFNTIVRNGYPSGGAGYVISKEALRRFGNRRQGQCAEDHGAEDVSMGLCMQNLGVILGDSRDALGKSRFHCFDVETHLRGGYPDWYYQYDKYGAKKGTDSVSDYAISFHYVTVERMYELEFYIYRLRPFRAFRNEPELNQKPGVSIIVPTTTWVPYVPPSANVFVTNIPNRRRRRILRKTPKPFVS